jgi:hypothetical protein
LEGRDKEGWEALKGVLRGFLGNKRDVNYTVYHNTPTKIPPTQV